MKLKGFQTREFTSEVGIGLISLMEGIGSEAAYERAQANYACFDSKDNRFYVLQKVYPPVAQRIQQTTSESEMPHVEEMLVDLIKLIMTLSLVRLFKEGDIRAPLAYGLIIEDRKPRRLIKQFATNTLVSRIPFELKKEELAPLNEFLKSNSLPLANTFLNRPFKYFEDSYATHSNELAFTSLMIGLECLFHRPRTKPISKEVPENCAALLSADDSGREMIRTNLTVLYEKRSNALHEGESITKDEILMLRDYLRQSIKKALQFNLGATELKRWTLPTRGNQDQK